MRIILATSYTARITHVIQQSFVATQKICMLGLIRVHFKYQVPCSIGHSFLKIDNTAQVQRNLVKYNLEFSVR